MRVISKALAFAALLVAGAAYAQPPSFTARLGRNPVGLGEAFSFEIALSVDNVSIEDYRRPDFRGFRVLAEQPSQSTQIRWAAVAVSCARTTAGTTSWWRCKKAS
jgi:hypothetical protein